MMSFHLWCSLKSIMEDFVKFCLFQRTLMGATAKWYIEKLRNTHCTFESISKVLLTFFQLHVQHESGIKILTTCHQTTAIHISYHIHQWRKWQGLCKSKLDDIFLKDLFLKSLLHPITLVNLGHFATTISTLLQCFVVDIATNLGSPKCCFVWRGTCDNTYLKLQERRH